MLNLSRGKTLRHAPLKEDAAKKPTHKEKSLCGTDSCVTLADASSFTGYSPQSALHQKKTRVRWKGVERRHDKIDDSAQTRLDTRCAAYTLSLRCVTQPAAILRHVLLEYLHRTTHTQGREEE